MTDYQRQEKDFIRLLLRANDEQRAAIRAFMIATIKREAIKHGFFNITLGGIEFNIILN